jgi:hypothetical protein
MQYGNKAFACCLLQAAFLFGLLLNLDVLLLKFIFQRSNGVVFQMTELFVTTAVRASNQISVFEQGKAIAKTQDIHELRHPVLSLLICFPFFILKIS